MSPWLKVGGAVAVASLLIEIAIVLPLGHWMSQLVDWMRGAGLAGAIAYAVVYVLAALLMIPGSLLTAGAGLAYGPWWGTLLVSPVSVAAATLAFLLGRTVARGWIARRTEADAKFRAVDAAIGTHGFKVVALLRLSPLFPFNVLNYALGLTGVRLRDYALGSFVGMLPGTFLYVYLGSLVGDVAALSQGTAHASTARQALSLVGLAATVIVTTYVTRLARRALADELSGSAPVAAAPGP
jgi:uncharacterized membrane protein YdjX (TVP38/TMEM64 family)